MILAREQVRIFVDGVVTQFYNKNIPGSSALVAHLAADGEAGVSSYEISCQEALA